MAVLILDVDAAAQKSSMITSLDNTVDLGIELFGFTCYRGIAHIPHDRRGILVPPAYFARKKSLAFHLNP